MQAESWKYATNARSAGDNSALSKLQPAQVRELRDGFQLLDRDSDAKLAETMLLICWHN